MKSAREDQQLEADTELGQTGSTAEPVGRTHTPLKLNTADDPSLASVQPPAKKSRQKLRACSEPLSVINRGSQLAWNQKLVLIGRKVENITVHICEKCNHPVYQYGRMKRCKHSFCLSCTVNSSGKCPRCGELNDEHEKGEMGGVYVCSYGGSRYGHSGCRRSYLSQRDLQAHIKYRHGRKTEKRRLLQSSPFPPEHHHPPPSLAHVQGVLPPLTTPFPSYPPRPHFPGDSSVFHGPPPPPPGHPVIPFPRRGPGLPHMMRPPPPPPPQHQQFVPFQQGPLPPQPPFFG